MVASQVVHPIRDRWKSHGFFLIFEQTQNSIENSKFMVIIVVFSPFYHGFFLSHGFSPPSRPHLLLLPDPFSRRYTPPGDIKPARFNGDFTQKIGLWIPLISIYEQSSTCSWSTRPWSLGHMKKCESQVT